MIMMGTIGKSAQFPLQIWLPDAMEGPTPVSALIHAATMVAAGVFLLVRTYPLLEASHVVLPVVAYVGAITAFLAVVAQSQVACSQAVEDCAGAAASQSDRTPEGIAWSIDQLDRVLFPSADGILHVEQPAWDRTIAAMNAAHVTGVSGLTFTNDLADAVIKALGSQLGPEIGGDRVPERRHGPDRLRRARCARDDRGHSRMPERERELQRSVAAPRQGAQPECSQRRRETQDSCPCHGISSVNAGGRGARRSSYPPICSTSSPLLIAYVWFASSVCRAAGVSW
jgi:hypothetical protein